MDIPASFDFHFLLVFVLQTADCSCPGRLSCSPLPLCPTQVLVQALAGKAAFTPQQVSSIAAHFKMGVLQHLQLYRYLFTQQQEHDERSAALQVSPRLGTSSLQGGDFLVILLPCQPSTCLQGGAPWVLHQLHVRQATALALHGLAQMLS